MNKWTFDKEFSPFTIKYFNTSENWLILFHNFIAFLKEFNVNHKIKLSESVLTKKVERLFKILNSLEMSQDKLKINLQIRSDILSFKNGRKIEYIFEEIKRLKIYIFEKEEILSFVYIPINSEEEISLHDFVTKKTWIKFVEFKQKNITYETIANYINKNIINLKSNEILEKLDENIFWNKIKLNLNYVFTKFYWFTDGYNEIDFNEEEENWNSEPTPSSWLPKEYHSSLDGEYFNFIDDSNISKIKKEKDIPILESSCIANEIIIWNNMIGWQSLNWHIITKNDLWKKAYFIEDGHHRVFSCINSGMKYIWLNLF